MVLVRGDQRGAAVVGAGIGGGKGCCMDGACVMAGTVPGVLFYICLMCVRFLNLRTCQAVGLSAAIIGGAFGYTLESGDVVGHPLFHTLYRGNDCLHPLKVAGW